MKIYRRGSVYWLRVERNGREIRRSLGTRDSKAAQVLASDWICKDEMRRAGVRTAGEDQRDRPIADHVRDFEAYLRSGDRVERHIEDRMKCVRDFVKSAQIRTLKDLDVAKATSWLATVRATTSRSGSKLSARTVNGRYLAIRQFAKVMLRMGRLERDPFVTLRPLREADDRRHERRALTVKEFERLCAAACGRALAKAKEMNVRAGVSPEQETRIRAQGEARAHLYRFAVGTGLRAGEIGRLRWCDVDLEARRITVTAKSSKARKVQIVPLHPALAQDLKTMRPADAAPADAIFGPSAIPDPRTFWKDLEAAGIPRQDATGRWVDFHALRKSGITWMVAGGAHPRVAQAFARHASIETTMAHYTDPALLETGAALDRLPLSASVRTHSARDEAEGYEQRCAGFCTGKAHTSVPDAAATASAPVPGVPSHSREKPGKLVQGTASSVERPKGFEPSTFSLGS